METKPLNRNQRRIKERIENEAHLTESPEGDEVKEKIKQMSAQWKNYCHNRNLLPNSYDALKKYMEGVLNQYQKQKA